MSQRWAAIAIVSAAVLASACARSAGPSGVAPVTSAAASPAPGAAQPAVRGEERGGRHGGSRIDPAAVPGDFPASVPIYPGTVIGSTGRFPNWTVAVSVPDGAAAVQKAALHFYAARGFRTDTASIAHNAAYRVILLAVNDDHSPTATNLTIQVTAR
jgi:hypothetical protein